MKIPLILLCLILTGCGTRIYSPDGKPRFTTTANLQAKNIRVGDFSADELTLDHATPFKAIGDIVNQALTLAGAGAFLR